eukprot:1883788-Pyramimonas_sp.AAC.1
MAISQKGQEYASIAHFASCWWSRSLSQLCRDWGRVGLSREASPEVFGFVPFGTREQRGRSLRAGQAR